MNEESGHTGLRARLPLAPVKESGFRWRGNEVSRVEGFTDAVFGFAVTLLIVALEVPKTFEGLMNVVRGFPAFIICFALLMTFWNSHYRYHRRYGIEDTFTRVITMAICVLILFFVYPLKFLFTLVTVNLFGIAMPDAPKLAGHDQVVMLYVIYGCGFAGAWWLYTVLYWHAFRKRKELELDHDEIVLTQASLVGQLIYVGVCLLSVVLALTTRHDSLPGFIYFLLGPLQALNGWWFGRRLRKPTPVFA